MSGTPRRSFLKGLFAGVVGGGAVRGIDPNWGNISAGVVVRATPEQVQAFADPLELEQPIVADQVLEGDGETGADAYACDASSRDDVAALFAALDRPVAIDYIDMPDAVRDHYQYHTQAEMGRLRAAGYAAPFTSLEDGVADYVKRYLAAGDPYP